MLSAHWGILPFPYSSLDDDGGLPPLDALIILEHLLHNATGMAGTLAAAAHADDYDTRDLLFTSRHLAEVLKSICALWRLWRAQGEVGDLCEDEALT